MASISSSPASGFSANATAPVQAGSFNLGDGVGGGTAFSCAHLADLTVSCWGRNTAGQLGNGTNGAGVPAGVYVPVTGLNAFAVGGSVVGDGSTVLHGASPPATAALGLSPFDLQPGSTMNNGLLEGNVQSAGGNEITLNYKSGAVKVLVPPGTPMSRAVPGNRSDIKPGETIFIAARATEDGKFTALRVQVSTNGVKPTQ